jgi:hypothetical protein
MQNAELRERTVSKFTSLVIILGFVLSVFSVVLPAAAQSPQRPMIMPAAGDPGPNTWMFGQAYGNTTGAFNFGDQWYEAGQGLHFGIDLSMPCGTPLVAVADGTIQFVDDRGFGSMPHNLIVRHDALGLTTLYGHLLRTPSVMPGQFVEQGQVIGLSGDPDETCDSRPHLHFEVRSLDYSKTVNPAEIIDANWHNLAMIGPYGFPLFQHDLTNPRRWVNVEDQPDVYFWGGILNRYTTTYPPSSERRPAANPIPSRATPPVPENGYQVRQLTRAGCCAIPQWNAADPSQFYLIDGPAGSVASVYAWNINDAEAGGTLVRPAPLPFQSPYGIYEVEPFINGFTKIRAADTEVNVDTRGRIPTVNPANTALLWSVSDGVTIPGQARPLTRVYISQINGDSTREIYAAPGASARWLDSERIVIAARNEQRETSLYIYDLTTNTRRDLGIYRELRGLDTSPGGRYITFYLSWQSEPSANGIYQIDTLNGDGVQRMNWFGAWRWRDDSTLYYVPFEPDAPAQTLRLFNVETAEDIQLTDPAVNPFVIANGYWEVSPDGLRVLYQDARDKNVYVLEPTG